MCCNLKKPALPKSPAFQAIAPYATAVPTHVVKLCRSLDKPGSSRRYKQFCPVLLLRRVMGVIKSHIETDFSLPCHAQIFLALTQVICAKGGVVDFCCYLSVTPGTSLKIVIIIVCWVQKRFSVQHSNKWYTLYAKAIPSEASLYATARTGRSLQNTPNPNQEPAGFTGEPL